MIKKRYRSIIVESVSEYVDEVCSLNLDEDVLFRGQRENWSLVPKIARLNFKKSNRESERDMLNDFIYRSSGMITRPPSQSDHWNWLSIAQHHGMATRFLDWSTSSLGALWFATAEPRHAKCDAVVWVFTPDVTTDYVKEGKDSPFTRGRTLIYRPLHIADRIRAQDGWFTCHKPVKNGKFIPLEELSRFANKLKKIKIPHDYVPDIRGDLDRLGINRSTLFPDLDGIAKHSQWFHTVDFDES